MDPLRGSANLSNVPSRQEVDGTRRILFGADAGLGRDPVVPDVRQPEKGVLGLGNLPGPSVLAHADPQIEAAKLQEGAAKRQEGARLAVES